MTDCSSTPSPADDLNDALKFINPEWGGLSGTQVAQLRNNVRQMSPMTEQCRRRILQELQNSSGWAWMVTQK